MTLLVLILVLLLTSCAAQKSDPVQPVDPYAEDSPAPITLYRNDGKKFEGTCRGALTGIVDIAMAGERFKGQYHVGSGLKTVSFSGASDVKIDEDWNGQMMATSQKGTSLECGFRTNTFPLGWHGVGQCWDSKGATYKVMF